MNTKYLALICLDIYQNIIGNGSVVVDRPGAECLGREGARKAGAESAIGRVRTEVPVGSAHLMNRGKSGVSYTGRSIDPRLLIVTAFPRPTFRRVRWRGLQHSTASVGLSTASPLSKGF